MSDAFLRIIPGDPVFVPPNVALDEARRLLTELAPRADDVTVQVKAHPSFVDPGTNFERVSCPACGAELTDWWFEAMDRAAGPDGGFADLEADLPCCTRKTSLNALTYEMPAGFARVILEVRNPQVAELTTPQREALSSVLGCDLRVVWAQY